MFWDTDPWLRKTLVGTDGHPEGEETRRAGDEVVRILERALQ